MAGHPSGPPSDQAATPPALQKIWPWWVRLLHWVLALSVLASYANHDSGSVWHEWLGWLALGVAVLRVLMGLKSRHPYGSLRGWFHGPTSTLAYSAALLRGRAHRHLGHNPLGGWMMALLVANTLACGATGWLYTTDRFWGLEWMEDLHGALGQAFVPLVLLHVVGAVWASWKQRENLVAAMVHGRKRGACADDVP